MKTLKEYDVVVVGDYCLDVIFSGLPSFPVLGDEIIAKTFIQTPGGTCNSVIAMHRLGLKVGWAADFGTDDYSKSILLELKKEGVDSSLFFIHNRSLRKITVALSYPKDRAFIAYYDSDPLIPAGFKRLTSLKAKHLHVPGIYSAPGTTNIIRFLHSRGINVSMDGNSSKIYTLRDKRFTELLANLDIFFANKKEVLQITQEQTIEKAIQKLGEIIPLVVIKDGANGAYAMEKGNLLFSPSIKVKVIDTTGAGDCFNAGFIKAWLSGKSTADCLNWGNIVGGLSTTAMGGTGRYITSDEVEKNLRTYDRVVK